MQITLIETELKQAITEYLGRQMKIADGMEMAIELAATRGAEGFKATIDIRPIDPSSFKAQPKTVEPPIRQQPFVVQSTARSPEPNVVEEPSSEEAPFNQVDETRNETVSEETAQTEEQPAPSNTRSLFKGLSKPKN